jgi:hypothetical protein
MASDSNPPKGTKQEVDPAETGTRFSGIQEMLNSGQTIFTLKQVAQAMLVSIDTAEKWVKSGTDGKGTNKLPILRLGSTTRVELQPLVMFINHSAQGYHWSFEWLNQDELKTFTDQGQDEEYASHYGYRRVYGYLIRGGERRRPTTTSADK